MQSDLVCVGLTTLDILGRPIESIPDEGKTTIIEQIRLTPAGTAAGCALNAAKLGLKTSLVAAVGRDDAGRFVEASLARYGVDTSLMQHRDDLPTSTTILAVSTTGQRPNFHAIGASIMVEIDAACRERIRHSRFLHWAGVGTMLTLDGEPAAGILREAQAAGVVTCCDLISPGPQTLPALQAALPHVDYFIPSLEEAMEIAGTTTPEDTARFYLGLGAKVCIFKWGARGSWLATSENQRRIPAFRVDVVDTTGCGDSYCAGFITGLARGWDLEQCCLFATATSALVATGLGSDAGVQNFEATISAMQGLPVLED